ncbi:acetate--CoA ligase family protein [Sinorhizobium meliloti]|uniref:acetate--CoA ligase family protein n=1 Tax=Rhizobium meliloti TaxID=382 RepID=UPI0003A6CB92|nr:acetate--CoA ligase family protein [Sinorhizobium meliloti]
MANIIGSSSVEKLLRPLVIAIVGASRRGDSVGRRVLNSVANSRYAGRVYAVNPNYTEIGRIPCFSSISALPERPDCVVLCVRDSAVEETLEEAGRTGVRAAVLFGRGYDPEAKLPLPDRLAAIARRYGMAICGGNCMGFLNALDDLRVSFGAPRIEGSVSGVSVVVHSGSIWEWLIGNRRNLAFDFAVSAGQEIATSCADYLDFFLEQESTRVIGCVIETIRDPRAFIAALEKARARGIPVVVLKLGRSEKGKHFAKAHTGALTTSYVVYEALFERYNVVAVDTLDEFLDTLEIFRFGGECPDGGIATLTHSGGERQLIVDIADRIGADIAEITAASSAALAEVLEPGLSPENPVDAWGDGKLVGLECIEILARDPNVAVISLAADLFFSAGMGYSLQLAENAKLECKKPFVVFGAAHASVVPEAASRLRALRIPVLAGAETALRAMKHFINWHRSSQIMSGDEINSTLCVDRSDVSAGSNFDAQAYERLLISAGIPVAESRFANSQEEACKAASQLGFPVVLKTANPLIEHKTEHGGVVLNLMSEAEFIEAYDRMSMTCGHKVQVQKQYPGGTEILLGMVKDDQFGPIITLALGGVTTELFRDSVSFLPPVTMDEALGYIRRLKAFPLLDGFRGRPKANVQELAALVERFSVFCGEVGGLFSEIDVNPVIVTAEGAVAVDALFIRDDNPNSDSTTIPASKVAHG